MRPTSIERRPNFLLTGSRPRSTSPEPFASPLQRSAIRVAAIGLVFALQGLWLTIRFDTATIALSSDHWERFVRILPMLPRIGMCLLVSIPLLGMNRILGHAHNFALAVHEYRGWSIWWSVQWTAFAILTVASLFMFSDDLPAGPIWVAVWITSAFACCASCLCAVAPPGFWWRFACAERWVLLASIATSLCATGAGRLFQTLWNPLGEATFRLVAWWLSFLYSQSIVTDADHRLLGTQSFYVQIAPQCSGYEGIGLITVFMIVFLAMFRQTLRFPRALLLWPIGILLIWICNSLRIAALIVIGTEYSASVALGGFHSQAGWILFNLVSLGLMAGALQSEFFARIVKKVDRTPREPAVPYLVPFLVLTALSMAIAALVDDPSALYPLTVVTSLGVLWKSREVLRRLTWTWSPNPVLHGIAIYLAWTGLAWADSQARGIGSVPLPPCTTLSGLTWTIFRVFGAVVTVPIIEELAFRGFLLRRLVHSDYETVEYRNVPIWAVLVCSVAFGMLHEFWIGGTIAGISYAWLTRRRGNLADAIQAHAVTNGLIALTVLRTGATWLW